MEIGLILKIAGIGILVSIISSILCKAGKDEQANLVSLVGMVVILALIVERVGMLVTNLKGIFGL